jgi:hypothetical protein
VGGRDPDVGYEGVLSEAPSTRDDQMFRPLLMSAQSHKRTFIGANWMPALPEADGLIGVAVPFRPPVEKNFNHSNECQFFRFNVREDFL